MLYFKVFFVLKYIKITYFFNFFKLIFNINITKQFSYIYIYIFFFYFRCHFATWETKNIIFGWGWFDIFICLVKTVVEIEVEQKVV